MCLQVILRSQDANTSSQVNSFTPVIRVSGFVPKANSMFLRYIDPINFMFCDKNKKHQGDLTDISAKIKSLDSVIHGMTAKH